MYIDHDLWVCVHVCFCPSVPFNLFSWRPVVCKNQIKKLKKNKQKTRLRKTKLYWKRVFFRFIWRRSHSLITAYTNYPQISLVCTPSFGRCAFEMQAVFWNLIWPKSQTNSSIIDFLDSIVVEKCKCESSKSVWKQNFSFEETLNFIYFDSQIETPNDTEENISNPTENCFSKCWMLRSFIHSNSKTIDRKITK